METIFLNVQTTGLDPDFDSILEIAICDINKKILYQSFFKPSNVTFWGEAKAYNGISEDMVLNAPMLVESEEEIKQIMSDKVVCSYIKNFTQAFIPNLLEYSSGHVDLMRAFIKNQNIADSIELLAQDKAANLVGFQFDDNESRTINKLFSLVDIYRHINNIEIA